MSIHNFHSDVIGTKSAKEVKVFGQRDFRKRGARLKEASGTEGEPPPFMPF